MLAQPLERIGLKSRLFQGIAVILVGIVGSWLLGNPTLAWQFRAALLFVMLLVFLFWVTSEVSLYSHLYAAILILAFGWRTERIAGVVLDAQQIFAWTLCVHLFIYSAVQRRAQPLRGWQLVFIPLLVVGIGVLRAAIHGHLSVYVFNEVMVFSVSAPVVFSLYNLVRTPREYQRVEVVLAVTILLMAIPGLVEYVQALLAQDIGRLHVRYVSSFVGFVGAPFSLWGTPTISYALTPLVVLMLGPLFASDVPLGRRWLFFLATLIGMLAIVVAGQRGAWIGMAVGFLAFAWFGRRGRLLSLALLVGVWFAMPDPTRATLLALFDPTPETGIYDSSALNRYLRIQGAVRAIHGAPWLGRGWAGSGWVHSDILQLAANVGIPATLLLFTLWLYPFGRLLACHGWEPFKVWKRMSFEDARTAALIAAAISALVLLATEALIVISVLSLPIWILFGLGWARYAMTRTPIPIRPDPLYQRHHANS